MMSGRMKSTNQNKKPRVFVRLTVLSAELIRPGLTISMPSESFVLRRLVYMTTGEKQECHEPNSAASYLWRSCSLMKSFYLITHHSRGHYLHNKQPNKFFNKLKNVLWPLSENIQGNKGTFCACSWAQHRVFTSHQQTHCMHFVLYP